MVVAIGFVRDARSKGVAGVAGPFENGVLATSLSYTKLPKAFCAISFPATVTAIDAQGKTAAAIAARTLSNAVEKTSSCFSKSFLRIGVFVSMQRSQAFISLKKSITTADSELPADCTGMVRTYRRPTLVS